MRLHGIFTARLTAEPLYELKTAFSHHADLCAEHATAIRTRVSEMREPPLGLDEVPHPALELLCNEVLSAPTTILLLVGIYEVLVPELITSYEEYIATTNPLVDAPSVRVARFARLELHDIADFGRKAISACARRGSPDPFGTANNPLRIRQSWQFLWRPVAKLWNLRVVSDWSHSGCRQSN